MRTYYGTSATEERSAFVTVRDTRGPKPLVHHLHSSPIGFDWGSGGNGPADLARSILLDAFGITECPTTLCICENRWVDSTHEAFKSDIVSKLAKDEDWKLYQGDITDWVFDYLNVDDEETPRPTVVSL